MTVRLIAEELKEFEEEIIPHLNTNYGKAIIDLLNAADYLEVAEMRVVSDPRLVAEPDTGGEE